MPYTATPPVSRLRAESMLVITVFFWGWTFPVVKDAIHIIPVFAFLFVRFGLASVLMMPFAARPTSRTWRQGLFLGILLFLGFAFQTWSLLTIGASVAAFITSLSVVWVAVVGARTVQSWVAVSLAVIGLAVLTSPTPISGLGWGEILAFGCSLFFAWHILAVAKLQDGAPSYTLTVIQLAVVSVLSLLVSLVFEPPWLSHLFDFSLWINIAITVCGATIFAYWAQVHYQRYTTALRAALIFILEPIFAAIISIAFYDDILTHHLLVGSLFIIAAMVVINYKKRVKASKPY